MVEFGEHNKDVKWVSEKIAAVLDVCRFKLISC